MPTHSRLESLPAELLSGILTRCKREDLFNLAQTCSNLRVVCRQRLINYPLNMKVTSKNLKSWVAYFRTENTLLARGARSLNITIAVTKQDLLDAFGDVDPTVFDVDVRPIHPDASRILPLPSSLRKLFLKLDWMPGPDVPSISIVLLLLRSLPERCPHLEELSIQDHSSYSSDEVAKCIHRLTHLRKLHLHVRYLSRIEKCLSLLPASLTDLCVHTMDISTQGDVITAATWARGIQKFTCAECAPGGIPDLLMNLSRGGATHLTKLILREGRGLDSTAGFISLRESLTAGLQELSLLQPPLHTLSLTYPSRWSDSLHLPLLHTAAASTLTKLSLQYVDSCIFPSHLTWPRLQSLELSMISEMGYEGPLTAPIFPVLTALYICSVPEIRAPEDLFPALETIKWKGHPTPRQVATLVHHDLKRIDINIFHTNLFYELLWEAMGGHTIDVVALKGWFPCWIRQLTDSGERIFPKYPNIREFAIEWTQPSSAWTTW